MASAPPGAPPGSRGPSQQSISRWSAVTVPLMIVAIVAWASYVVVGKLAVTRLISRSQGGAGTAVVVLYCLLLLLTAGAYLRIIATVAIDPGLVSLGRASASARARRSSRRSRSRKNSSGGGGGAGDGRGRRSRKNSRAAKGGGGAGAELARFEDEDVRSWAERQHDEKMKKLEKFIPREVFVCDYDGLPLWCDKCSNWKPDRTHHCSDLGRCVRRMDHFCPWVGGIVSETTMKFFLQFTFYGSFLAVFVLITDAVLLARDRSEGHKIDAHLAVLLGFSALFTLFTVGIFGNTFFMTLRNLTTVEALNRGNATYHLSVLVTPSWCRLAPNEQYPFRTTQYPGAPGAVYAILLTRPGDNPWDLGALPNLKSVLGENVLDWFLPIKMSPCTVHDSEESEFEMGPVVDWVKRDAVGY